MSDFVICDGYDSLYILNVFQALFLQLLKLRSQLPWSYCAFHKHANSKVQKPPSQLRFSLPSIIITITNSEPGNTETHKTDRNPPITNHKPWPFEPVKVSVAKCRGSWVVGRGRGSWVWVWVNVVCKKRVFQKKIKIKKSKGKKL